MMSYPMASYNQLVRLVEDLHKENSHLRRELQDNSHHLSKLENETSDMKVVLRQLQNKLEQEAGTLSSSGRNDELDQLKELHMDLTNYYELKFQPYEVRTFPETMASHGEGVEEERLSISGRAPSPLCPLSQKSSGEGAVHPGHLHLQESLEGRVTAQHLEELCKERCMLLCEIEKEEKEQLWYYSQLQSLSQKLAKLPRLDTFSIQVDLIRQQLQFEAQQLRSVMEKRFGTSDEMVQRTQIRVARLEQLEKELHDSQSSCPQVKKGLVEAQSTSKMPALEADSGNAGVLGAHGEAGSKVEMVFWILSMLASRDREEVSRTLLAMSSSPESCVAMRKSGCVLLLVQILHEGNGEAGGTGYSREARSRASAALHNIIYSQPDEGQARREMRVLHVLEQIRSHCENGWDWIEKNITAPSTNASKTTEIPEPVDPHICQALCTVMKLSFEEEYRRAMNELGALQAIAELMLLDHELYAKHNEPINMALRRYGGMALTNLTYGDVVNKATLCSKKRCLQAIVAQLGFDSEDLQQVVSSILRNLSWRADVNSKRTLRDAGSVSALMTCALQATRESTLKSVLSALWNLSAHSTENKVAICSVDGALGFLVSTLTYRCQTNSLAIIESGGGILRNVSSLIATRDDYRQMLREHNCLHTLLQHLRSHSLTIVSNACGTLWNLSARCPIDQELLWDLGAVSMLRNLIHSKHKIIAMGSSAALRNLLSNRPLKYKDTAVISPGSCMPFLYMRKQKALEAELNAKHLAETFDLIEKQSCKHQNINKPLRQVESLAKDYASDSGCFDDDEAPNVSTSLDTGTFSMLSTFLNSSNFLNKQEEPEQSSDTFPNDGKLSQIPDNEVTVVAEKLAKKITNTVAKIDKLVEDITMQTYSEDSFSLSSEDNYLDWKSGPDDPHEAQAISCSPCVLSQTSSFPQKECLGEAHDFMLLKTLSSSLANDSLHSDSASDGYCGSHDQIYDSTRPKEQQRPNKLDLKVTHEELLSSEMQRVMSQNDLPERDLNPNRDGELPDSGSSGTEKSQEFLGTPATVSNKMSSDSSIPTVKLSPSYLHVPLIPSGAKFDVVKPSINLAAQTLQKQAWVPTVMTGGNVVKFSPICSTKSPTIGQLETLQKYSVENTPICFSRCSSLSSLSSGDEAVDGQSQTENELESDSSLEIIEVEDISDERKDDGTFDHLSDSDLLVTDDKVCAGNSSTSTEIPSTFKNDKFFKEVVSNLEDMTPSSSSDNYLHETPLVMSRCSSVSSLGSFESPSIASSIQSDPCSEIVSGTISPSDLPDSPGQTMPPSRSKTPCCAESSGPDAQAHRGTESQWENSFCKLMEMADFKERFNLPSDLDTMIYFTVEKPVENFSCASSLSALPFHEHYVQKDVELRLNPLQDNDSGSSEKGVDMEEQDQYSEGNSDDDIEILKECINSAMPSRFKKVKPAVMSAISSHVLNMQTQKSLPMCMMLQNKTQMSALKYYKDKYHDGSYNNYDDGATGNYSKNTHLRDQHQYLVRADGVKERKKNKSSKEPEDVEEKRIEELRTFSRFHKATKKMSPPHIITNQPNKTIRHLVPSQKLLMHSEEIAKKAEEKILYQSPKIQKQGQNLSKSMSQLNISLRKQKTDVCPNHKTSALNYAHENTLSSKSLHQKQANEKAKSRERERKDENRLANMTKRKKHQLTKTSSVQNSNVKDKGLHYQSRKSGFQKIKQSLILEEAPPCYSLSSSLSSLSDSEFEEPCGNAQQAWKGNRLVTSNSKSQQNCHHFEDNSSASSVSMDSEDDLLFKCITSAMPQQKNKPTIRNRRVEKKNKQNNLKTANEAWDHENDMDSDEMCSEEDSDLNSVEWRAIQEEANTIITKLQASKSQESFTETESVLSFMSESSFTPKEKKVFKDDFMVNKPLDFAPRKPVPNLPVVFRGRTVTYMPKKETAPSQRPTPKKVTTTSKAPKNENLSQYRSRSLHRLSQSSDFAELSLPKRSSTPPARIPKSSSSGSSQSSTPCRQRPKRATFSTQITKQDQEKETSPTLDKFGNHTNTDQYSKSPIDRKTQKSPVRIPFMQNPSKRRTISPLVTNQSSTVSRINVQAAGKRIPPGNRLEIVRQGTTSNNSGFLRQLTFIKDSSIAQKRNGSSYSVPSLQHGSPRRAGSGPPTVFLCSSRCQELKKVAQGPRQVSSEQEGVCRHNKPLSRGMSATRNPTFKPSNRRTSSESPCRTQSAKPEPKKIPPRDENIKRYSSSPSIHLLSRVTSHSSLRSSSSDSSERAKSEKNASQMQKRAGSQKADRVTWRRIHDEEVPHILKRTLPSTALPLVQPSEDTIQLSRKLPKITLVSRKTSDATVQTEDCSASKTNSSTSPTKRSDLGFSEETTADQKASISIDSTSQDQESIVSVKTYSTFKSMESHSSGVGHFRQSSPSRAVRVTPFNYIPRPVVTCSPQSQGPSLIIPEKSREKV